MMLTPEDQAWIEEQMTLAGRPPAPKLEDYVPRDHDFTRGEYIMRKGMWRHAHAEWAANDLRHSTIYVPPPAAPQRPPRNWHDLIGAGCFSVIMVLSTIRVYQTDGWVAVPWMIGAALIPLAVFFWPRKKR